MLLSANGSTPTSGEITRIVRQHFIPKRVKAHTDEKITCRTDTKCQKDKPEDYWTSNYRRRQDNLRRGYYSAPTEAYAIVGGKLILDPFDLVTSSLSDNIDQKRCQRHKKRDIISQESEKKEIIPVSKTKKKTETVKKQDLIDAAPSAGFDDIKKLLDESRQRITFVRAGKPYAEHVREVEEQRKKEVEIIKIEETGMVIKSASSMLLHVDKPSDKSSEKPSRKTSPSKPSSASSDSGEKRKVKISDLLRSTSPPAAKLNRRQTLVAPKKDRMSFSCAGSLLHRKERQFRDHLQFLKSIYSVLNAIHNMKLRDLKSKVPLSLDVVERLQKDVFTREQDGLSSRGTNIKRTGRQSIFGHQLFANDSRMEFPTKQRLPSIQSGYLDNSPLSTSSGKRTGRQSIFGHQLFANDSRMEFPTKQRLPSIQSGNLDNNKFRSRGGKTTTSTLTVDTDQGESNRRNTMVGTFRRMGMMDGMSKQVFGRRTRVAKPSINQAEDNLDISWLNNQFPNMMSDKKRRSMVESVVKNYSSRRKSRFCNASSERPAIETWEDLLNVQVESFKGEPEKKNLLFQVGVLSKFMRWFREIEPFESVVCESVRKRQSTQERKENRLASIAPPHVGGVPHLSKAQLSKIQENFEKREKLDFKNQEDEKENPIQGDKAKKIPIWQQVAQEKSSTVFDKKSRKSPNRDETVERAKRNFYNLKSNVQKENNVQLEKMVRERLADFRLKFSAINNEDCVGVFGRQMQKLAEVVGINKAHFEEFEVQPSKWYIDLKAMTEANVSSSFLPQTTEVTNKLQLYAHMDHKTVSYAKAKLCLLTMSLPAYDICHIHMQKAIQFVLENILLGQESQFIEWLDHRKMPYVLVEVEQNP